MKKLLNQWTEKLRHHRRETDAKFLIKAQEKAELASQSGQTCMNCNVPLTGPFCHICGQKDDDLRRPFWTFLQALLDDIFSSDSRLVKSLVLLVLVPGGLTRAYVQGRRAAYVPPIRAYLVMSVVFFLTLELTDLALVDIKVTPKPTQVEAVAGEGEVVPSEPLTDSNLPILGLGSKEENMQAAKEARAELEKDLNAMPEEQRKKLQGVLDATGVSKSLEDMESGKNIVAIGGDGLPYDIEFSMFVRPELEGRIGLTEKDLAGVLQNEDVPEWAKAITRGFSKALVEPTRMNEVFNKWLPRVLIIIVPIFALLLRMTHWSKNQFYFNQLMFSLHYHTFLFMMMTALIVIVPRFGGEVGSGIFWFGSMFYMFVALKIAQDQGWIKTFFKFLFIWGCYFTIMSIGLFTAISFGLQEI